MTGPSAFVPDQGRIVSANATVHLGSPVYNVTEIRLHSQGSASLNMVFASVVKCLLLGVHGQARVEAFVQVHPDDLSSIPADDSG